MISDVAGTLQPLFKSLLRSVELLLGEQTLRRLGMRVAEPCGCLHSPGQSENRFESP